LLTNLTLPVNRPQPNLQVLLHPFDFYAVHGQGLQVSCLTWLLSYHGLI